MDGHRRDDVRRKCLCLETQKYNNSYITYYRSDNVDLEIDDESVFNILMMTDES